MATDETAGPTLHLRPRAALRLLSDERLAGLARRGDRRAFDAIFRRYHRELYRFCRAILADPDEAHDALQSTMEAALRALPDEERQIALRPWLYRVAHNESISMLRRRPAVVDPAALPESQEPGADSEAEPRERLRQLLADLDALPERQRSALIMRELSGLGYPEIAQALDASVAAARQVVYEARLALREVAQGRDLECDAVRRALSDGDGRILRGRPLRAHLRACEPCRDFRAAIWQWRSDLQALCPALPVAAASGLFAALLREAGKAGTGTAGPGGAGAASAAGAGVGGTATGAGAATTSIASSAALKATSIAAAVTIGAGAAGVSGTVHLPIASPADDPAPAGSNPARAIPAAVLHAAWHRDNHGRSGVASNRTAGPRRDASTGQRDPNSSSENAGAMGHGGQAAQAGSPGPGARRSVAGSGASRPESPASPPYGAGGNSSSNGATSPGRGRSASAPRSHARSGHARSGLEQAASHSPSLPEQARGKPASPPHAPGPPPGHGHGS